MSLKVFAFLPMLLFSCIGGVQDAPKGLANSSSVSSAIIANPQSTIQNVEERIAPPPSYNRTEVEEGSYASYLRNLPLKPEGSLVQYHFGGTKQNYGVYHAVVDLDIGKKDLHQCADAIMRLRAEYLWRAERYKEIHFNFTNGFRVDYSEWMKGRRMVVTGNKTYWNDRNSPSNSYADFWKYMELIFTYAGTASLEQELKPVGINAIEIGDILIQGGHPGHAVVIIDEARNSAGKQVYLIAQSYMPAQEIQILNNPNDEELSPWYELKEGVIETPEWTFSSEDLMRF